MIRFVLAIMLMATPATAGEVSDLLMKPGLMADIPDEDMPQYKHERKLGAAPVATKPSDPKQTVVALEDVTDGGVKLARISDRTGDRLSLSLSDSGESRVVAEFPIANSNPILLFFLENIVRTVSSQTGGSPFYIRNRIREALVTAQAGEQKASYTEVVLRPFAEDQNAARLGAFANLTITLRYDPAEPYRLLELLAHTETDGSGYSETMTLVGEK